MSLLQALILGIVQGLTEFFPISSSGHLKLAEHWFGLENLDEYITFDLTCHLGTLLAIFFVFWRDIKRLLMSDWGTIGLIVLATLPLFPLVLILKPIRAVFNMPEVLSGAFLLTSGLLFAGEKFGQERPSANPTGRWRSAIGIGVFQAMAIIPGVSRSGATISAARLFGWDRMQAARFSFLIAIPAILGGSVLEAYKVFKGEVPVAIISPAAYALGFAAAFLFGYITLKILLKLVYQRRLTWFAWYCLALAAASFLALNLR